MFHICIRFKFQGISAHENIIGTLVEIAGTFYKFQVYANLFRSSNFSAQVNRSRKDVFNNPINFHSDNQNVSSVVIRSI